MKSSSTFVKKTNGGMKRSSGKQDDAVGDRLSDGVNSPESEDWVRQELSAIAPVQEKKRERLVKSLPNRDLEVCSVV